MAPKDDSIIKQLLKKKTPKANRKLINEDTRTSSCSVEEYLIDEKVDL